MRILGDLAVTMDPERRVIPNGDIEVERNRIVQVGPAGTGPPLARAARDAAGEHGLRGHTHLAEGEQDIGGLDDNHQKGPVEHFGECGLLGPDPIATPCCQFSTRDVGLFARTGASIAHCLTCHTTSLTGYLPIRVVLEAGIRVGLGTNGPASNNSLDMLAEAKFATTLHRFVSNDVHAISAEQAFAIATIDPARAMGLGASTGSLEPGKKADIALIDLTSPALSPLHDIYASFVYSSASGSVDTMIVDGQVLVEHGELLGVSMSAVVAGLNRRSHRLTAPSRPRESLGQPDMKWPQ